MTTDQILEWGRANVSNKKAIDLNGQFSRKQTEQLRRELRQKYLDGQINVDGDYRHGYEEVFNSGEAIGVTNGHAPHFVVYYRQGALYYSRGA